MVQASQVYSAAGPPQALALRAGTTADVRAALLAARRRTLALADATLGALGTAYPGIPYAAELNPPLWELGHVAWFQEWWIAREGGPRKPSLLPLADDCYDSSRVAHASRWTLPLPGADGTREYLARTLWRTLRRLDRLPPDAGDDALYFFRLVALHEEMHAEAALYMAQTLGIAPAAAAAPPSPPARPPADLDLELELPGRRFRMGSGDTGFAFDNELPAHDTTIGSIRIDARAVSWSRYLPFVAAGGYERPEWWSPPGRDWLQRQTQRYAAHWRDDGGQWLQRRGERWQPVDPARAAVHLTAFEAEAWCRWAGRRLPSEAEWECAALALPGFRWGEAWEWTASPFEPYAGFTPHAYRDYSAPWFGTRRVLRGACPATSPALAHARYRNFFEPHRSDVFAGFRSCRDGLPAASGLNRQSGY